MWRSNIWFHFSEVKNSKFYIIIAEEAADCSNKEQMSLVLRFVDKTIILGKISWGLFIVTRIYTVFNLQRFFQKEYVIWV